MNGAQVVRVNLYIASQKWPATPFSCTPHPLRAYEERVLRAERHHREHAVNPLVRHALVERVRH
jgi:hypothetical protein